MTCSVEVELARVCDREHVLEALSGEGLEARLLDEEGRIAIEVRADGDAERVRHDLLLALESWVAARELPLVPVPSGDGILLRPPAG